MEINTKINRMIEILGNNSYSNGSLLGRKVDLNRVCIQVGQVRCYYYGVQETEMGGRREGGERPVISWSQIAFRKLTLGDTNNSLLLNSITSLRLLHITHNTQSASCNFLAMIRHVLHRTCNYITMKIHFTHTLQLIITFHSYLTANHLQKKKQ